MNGERSDGEPDGADAGSPSSSPPPSDQVAADGVGAEELTSEPDVDHLLDHLEALEQAVDDPDERERVRETMRVARRIPGGRMFGRQIDKYTSRDVAESFVGSLLVSLPMLVEDVTEIGTHFAESPVFFAGNVTFVVLMTIGLLYWSDIQRVEITNPIFGIVPRRLVGVLTISFLTAAFTMTLWGRLDFSNAWYALCDVTVIWSAAAFGAALGDILPGESVGEDISE